MKKLEMLENSSLERSTTLYKTSKWLKKLYERKEYLDGEILYSYNMERPALKIDFPTNV